MKPLGVIIVTYNAAAEIRACLETLFAAGHPIDAIVVDNASTDGTAQVVSDWSTGKDHYVLPSGLPFKTRPVPKPVRALTLVSNSVNGGFAAGVNIGLRHMLKRTQIDRFWILNPDTLTPPSTPTAFAEAPDGFALMGGRLLYADPPYLVQTDGGTINEWTGVTGNLNLGSDASCNLPTATSAQFISGASMVASREFIEHAGPMFEDYFLYYEEVDWALQRGHLPLAICEDAIVYHRAGTAIGSPTLSNTASAFSTYYKYRARMKFLRKFNPAALPIAYLYAWIKACQFQAKGHRPQATAILLAIHGMKFSANKATQTGYKPIQRRT